VLKQSFEGWLRVFELLWLRTLLTENGFALNCVMNLFCNKTAIEIVHNPVQHDRTKHVEVDRHFIKQTLETKIIQFPFVKSEDQLADVLTKFVCNRDFYNAAIIAKASTTLKVGLPYCIGKGKENTPYIKVNTSKSLDFAIVS
jgi:hypothetical protein